MDHYDLNLPSSFEFGNFILYLENANKVQSTKNRFLPWLCFRNANQGTEADHHAN